MSEVGRGDRATTATSTVVPIVRLFPDYAGTVLWLTGPVGYAESRLDPALVDDLLRWEISYYDALDADFRWRSPAFATAFTESGCRLALRLAVELGDGFDIEFASYEPGVATRRFRSDSAADNPRAAAALAALAADAPARRLPQRPITPGEPGADVRIGNSRRA